MSAPLVPEQPGPKPEQLQSIPKPDSQPKEASPEAERLASVTDAASQGQNPDQVLREVYSTSEERSQSENIPLAATVSQPEATLPNNPFTERYRAQAEAKGIQPVQGGEWLVVDDVDYEWYGETTERIPSAGEQNTLGARVDRVGTYNYNNGTLAIVDQDGRLQIGHGTSENMVALEQAGYQREGMWVPFSNGELPSDPEVRQKYIELRERGREKAKQETTERHLQVYREVAEKKGIQEVEGGLWMMVDGIEYRHYGTETERVDVNTDGYNMPIRRVDQVGKYDYNNGRIAYVDGQGREWVGASTEENFDAITKAGYARSGVWVPFSNGEQPTNRATYEQLRDVLTGKPAEQLKAERTARVDEIIEGRRKLFGEAAHLPDRDQLLARVADSHETEYINSNEFVERRLGARIETDNAGFERRIYTVNGVTFSFRGREELPVYPTMSQSRTQLLGDTPQWVSTEDYQTYQAQVSETQKQENAPQHYITSKSLLGVVELAMQLGSRDTSLPQLREELTRGVYSERSIALLDALVAANYVGDGGLGVEPRANQNAEALVLAGLLGDPQAQTAIAQKVEELRHLEQQGKIEAEQEDREAEPLKPQELVAVHATKYEPAVGPNGEFIVQTTFDATKGKVLRNSVHTALNHKVAGHMYGSWGDAGYVIISPFESMMKANGVPTALNTVDTWWSRNPGESLNFPDATIVRPGGADVQGLYQTEGNSTKFKSEGLDSQDLITLANYFEENNNLALLSTEIEHSFTESIHPWTSLSSEWDLNAVSESVGKYLFKGETGRWHTGDPTLLRELTAITEGQPVSSLEQKLRGILDKSGAIANLRPEVQDREASIAKLVDTLASGVRSKIFAEISETATQEAIRNRGFEIHSGGMWAWNDSSEVTRQTIALGEILGSSGGAHSSTAQSDLTERFSHSVYDAESKGETNFDWTKYDPQYDDLVPRLDQKTRRVLYASGLLTSRG